MRGWRSFDAARLLLEVIMAPLLCACAAPTSPAITCSSQEESSAQFEANAMWRRLETDSSGRLDVAVYRPDGEDLPYRAVERFPVTSTFKALTAAGVLAQASTTATCCNAVSRFEATHW